jgi:hypothetical protein
MQQEKAHCRRSWRFAAERRQIAKEAGALREKLGEDRRSSRSAGEFLEREAAGARSCEKKPAFRTTDQTALQTG